MSNLINVCDSAVLDELKCSVCNEYLICSPVGLKLDGSSICGRCQELTQPEEIFRNYAYEELAQLLRFPCQYSKNGCARYVEFSKQSQHETNCEYRQLICPLVEPGQCEWIGTRGNLLKHCKEEHQDQIQTQFLWHEHDLTTNNLRTFLLVMDDFLFLAYIKLSLPTNKIYYSVRFLGDEDLATDFGFSVTIDNKVDKLCKYSDVAPQGCMAIQEDSSMAISIDSILEIFGDFEALKFELFVQQK